MRDQTTGEDQFVLATPSAVDELDGRYAARRTGDGEVLAHLSMADGGLLWSDGDELALRGSLYSIQSLDPRERRMNVEHVASSAASIDRPRIWFARDDHVDLSRPWAFEVEPEATEIGALRLARSHIHASFQRRSFSKMNEDDLERALENPTTPARIAPLGAQDRARCAAPMSCA